MSHVGTETAEHKELQKNVCGAFLYQDLPTLPDMVRHDA